MSNPLQFLAPLNGSLAFRDRAGVGSLTGSGAVRYQKAEFGPASENPQLLDLPLNGVLAGTDRAGANTATVTGPVRYQPMPGARWNYCVNGGFETGVSGWSNYTGTGSSVTREHDTSESVGGSASAKVTISSLLTGAGIAMQGGYYAPTDGSQQWTAGAWVKCDPGVVVRLYLFAYSASGTYMAADANSVLSTATTDWQYLTNTWTVPAAANLLAVGIYYQSGDLPARFWVDDVILSPGATVGDYFDGSIGEARWLNPRTSYLGTAHLSPSVSRVGEWIWEGTTNTVPDPSFEAAVITTSWGVLNSATISKVTTHAYIGSNGGKVSCTASTSDGITQTSASGGAALTGQTWTIQARVRAFASGDVGKTVALHITERTAADAPVIFNVSSAFTLTDAWQLCTYTVTLSGGGTVAKVTARLSPAAAVAVDFVVDAVQLEQKAYATPYADGSLGTGHSWSGTAHASTSVRTDTRPTITSIGHTDAYSGSFAGWVYKDVVSSSSTRIFELGQYGGSAENLTLYYIASGGGSISIVATRGALVSNIANAGTFPVGQANFVYAEWSPSHLAVSVNGGALSSVVRNVQPQVATDVTLRLGSGMTVTQNNSTMYGFQFYDQPLKEADVTALYNGGTPLEPSFTRFANQYYEPARINYCPNPQLANADTGWSANVGGSRVADADFDSGWAYEATSAVINQGITSPSATVLNPGTYTFSLDIKLTASGGTNNWYLYAGALSASGISLAATGGFTTFTPTMVKTRISGVVTITTAGVHKINLRIHRGSGSSSGDSTIRVSNLVIEAGANLAVPPYFEGVWLDPITGILGTAHASPSVSQAAAWVEEGTTNLHTNPSCEYASVSGYFAVNGATITKDTAYAYIGISSFKIVTPNVAINEGVAFKTASGLGYTGSVKTFSSQVRARGSGEVQVYQFVYYTDLTTVAGTASTVTLTDTWTKIVPPTLATDSAKTVDYIATVVRTTTQQAATFYVDAIQIEEKAYATSYTDGSLGTGYAWSGTAHASASTRTATSITVAESTYILPAQGAFIAKFARTIDNGLSSYVFFSGRYNVAGHDCFQVAVLSTDVMHTSWRNGIVGEVSLQTRAVSVGEFLMMSVGWSSTLTAQLNTETQASIGGRAYQGLISSGNAKVGIGGSTGGSSLLNGLISNVAIFDRPLTDAELDRIDLVSSLTWDSFSDRIGGVLQIGAGTPDAPGVLVLGGR